MPNPKRLLETLYGVNMQDGGSPLNQFAAKSRGASSLPGYGEGAQDIQQALAAIQESPAGRIASGVGEFAEGYMSGAGSTDLQKIGQGLSMIPVLGLPATVSKTIKTARVGDAITDSLRAKYPNVDISVAGDNTLYLGKMVVPKEQRNQGIGTQVMNDLVKQADDIGATVTLSPSADFGGNKEKLKEFYKRFGFVQNTGKNKDFAISESMYRTPQENLPTNFSDLGAMATQAYADYKANPNQLNALRYQRIKKAADDAYVKTQATPSKPVVTNEDYRGLHTAPTRAGGAPLHDLTQTYPDDIYSSRASQYYGHGEPRDAAVVSLAQSFKGRPHQMVTVYRAVPKNAKDVINAGDWVTIDRPYAKSHGESALRGDYKILSKRVRANEIFTNGDSIYEWGYDPVEAIKKAAGGAIHMQDGGSPLDRFMGKTPKRGVSSLPGYGQGNVLQSIEGALPSVAGGLDVLLTGAPVVAKALTSPVVSLGTFAKEAAASGDPRDTSPLERAREASQEYITGNIRLPQTETGIRYLENIADTLEDLPDFKIPPIIPQLMTAPSMPGISGALRDVAKTASKAKIPDVPAPKAATIPTQGVTYETTTEGPFYRVRPSVSQAPAGQRRGTLESDGLEAGQRPAGGTGSDVPQPITNEAVQQVMADPANFVRRSADTYTQDVLGKPYELPEVSESSIFKQAPIGRTFMLATTDDPVYKQTVFDQYASQMPEVIQQSGAKNYDELLAASYRQLAKETDEQFKRLPISLSYHRAGEGNYRNSKQMLQDVYGNKHLYVFQGGDEHPYLKDVDPITGLNENEKFRAVHDFFGHAVHGNEFGPKGEEIAWAAHSQMYSPLARLAMSTETRGQNSTVNYTPLNAALKRTINELNMQRYEANRRGKTDLVKEIDGQLKEAWNGFQFAPQKPLLLPPEFISTKYEGEMPDYLRPLIKPEEGTFINKPMVHFSKQAGLTETDPAFYGTGIKGEEAARLGEKGSVRPRTYFYTDESVTPEPGLGPHRYRAMGENLYDLSADPLMLSMLARETTRIPMTASSNKGLAQPAEATNALERLIRDYGYAGYISPQSTKPSAVLFGKMPVTPYKQGGPMRKVHISNNPDTMELELAMGGAVRMGTGGKMEKIAQATKAAAFTARELKSEANKVAKSIAKENPKMAPEDVQKRAAAIAENNLTWTKQQKPALEKKYGKLIDAPASASLGDRLQNTPEVVAQRAQKAEAFLAQPTESWKPPRPELQAFDRSLIKDAMEGFPGIEQTAFPRYSPPRANIDYIQEMYQDPRNRALIESQIKRGLPLGGETFYPSLYPMKVAALERGIPEEKFNQFIYSTAPASARNSILNEMAVGQFLRDMHARGLPLDESTVEREMEAFKQKYGTGLPLMPVHRTGVKNVIEGNQDLRELSKADIPVNYKIPTYGTQKAGDFGRSIVLDVHEASGETQASRFHPYFTRQGGFGSTEYGAAEKEMLDIAKGLGLPGGTAQAGRWFGGGELTGLVSPRGDALDLLERQAAYTLNGMGVKPTPRNVRNYLLDMIETGEGVLMPYYSKKVPLPDVRTEKKKGGAVKKSALDSLKRGYEYA